MRQLFFYMVLANTTCLLFLLYQLSGHGRNKLISALSVVQKQNEFENQQLDSLHVEHVMNLQVYTSSDLAIKHAEQVISYEYFP